MRPGRPRHASGPGRVLPDRNTGPAARLRAGRRNRRGPAEKNMKPNDHQNNHPAAESGPGARAAAEALRPLAGRTSNTSGGPRPRPEYHLRNEGREPAVPVTAFALIGCDRHGEAGR